jgi:hypothetical protein
MHQRGRSSRCLGVLPCVSLLAFRLETVFRRARRESASSAGLGVGLPALFFDSGRTEEGLVSPGYEKSMQRRPRERRIDDDGADFTPHCWTKLSRMEICGAETTRSASNVYGWMTKSAFGCIRHSRFQFQPPRRSHEPNISSWFMGSATSPSSPGSEMFVPRT